MPAAKDESEHKPKISITVSREHLEQIKLLMSANERSMSQVVGFALRAYLPREIRKLQTPSRKE